MIDLDRQGDVFTMTLNAGENRWNTTFVRAIDEVHTTATGMANHNNMRNLQCCDSIFNSRRGAMVIAIWLEWRH